MLRQNHPLSRRQFLHQSCSSLVMAPAVVTLGAAVSCTSPEQSGDTGSSPEPKEQRLTGLQSTAPSETLVELDDQRLLATVEGPSGVISEDAGMSWSEPFRYQQNGKPFEGSVYPDRAVARLNNGHLGMVYYQEGTAPAGYQTRQWYFASSSDEGHDWTEGNPIDMPLAYDRDKGVYYAYFWGSLFQHSNGRLIVPAYWYMGGRHPEVPPQAPYPAHGFLKGERVGSDGHLFEAAMGGSFVYFSDDLGKTWRRSVGSVMVWPLPAEDGVGGFGAAWEPIVIELRDGRLLMFIRTNVGRLYQSFSEDGGDHWSLAEPTELASGDVKCYLGRLRTTGDLIAVWSQSSTEELESGYSRGRLTLAVSRDEAKTWENFCTIERSEGMQPIARVAAPPVRHVRPRVKLGEFPDGYDRNHYPTLAFVQQKVVIAYRSGVLPPDRKVKLLAIPEQDIYR